MALSVCIGAYVDINLIPPQALARGGATGKEIGAAAKVKSRISKSGKKIDKLASKSVSNRAGSIQRQMNKIEKQTVANIYESRQSQKKMSKISGKADKLASKALSREGGPSTRDARKMKKLEDKYNREASNYKAATDNVKKGESETWKLIAKAAKNGYDVSSKEKNFNQVNGGLIQTTVSSLLKKGDIYQKGNQYTVTSDRYSKMTKSKEMSTDSNKTSRQQSSTTNSPRNNARELANAKKNDMCEMSFLEAIQNDEHLMGDSSKDARDREYAKYLKDRQKYLSGNR